MKKHRIRKMLMMGALCMGICLFGDRQTCQAAEVLTSDSLVSIWQEESAQANVEVKKEQEEVEVVIDTGKVTEQYEMFLLFVINEELFSASKTDAIVIEYSYDGDAPLYVSTEMNEADGRKLFTEGTCSYIEEAGDKYYLCKMENGQFMLTPGENGKLLIPVAQLEEGDTDFQNFYGITFSCLAEQKSNCRLQLKNISMTSDNRLSQYSEMADTYIEGTGQITIPYMGTAWFDYSLVGNEATFFAQELPEGCTLEESGRLILTEEAEEGEVVLEAEVGNGFFVKKAVTISKPVDMGYEFKTPDDMEQTTYALDFFTDTRMMAALRIGVLGIAAIAVVLFIWTKCKIRKDMKATEEEEMF